MRLHPGYEQRPEDSNFIDMQETPMHEGAIAHYLREAWKEMHGQYPSNDTLAIVWSQVVLETGRNTNRVFNSKMRNYNYGNIKKNLDYSPYWTSYDAGEFLNGKHQMFYPYHPQTHFAAWKTPLDGAVGYLNFLSRRKRYANAWIELKEGDTVGYVKELKVGGYFTAPLDKYTRVVVKLTSEFKSRHDELLAWQPPKKPTVTSIPDPEPVPEADTEPEEVTPPTEDIKPTEPLEEPPEPITDLVPDPTTEGKLKGISQFFLKLWSFILKAIQYFKRN